MYFICNAVPRRPLSAHRGPKQGNSTFSGCPCCLSCYRTPPGLGTNTRGGHPPHFSCKEAGLEPRCPLLLVPTLKVCSRQIRPISLGTSLLSLQLVGGHFKVQPESTVSFPLRNYFHPQPSLNVRTYLTLTPSSSQRRAFEHYPMAVGGSCFGFASV